MSGDKTIEQMVNEMADYAGSISIDYSSDDMIWRIREPYTDLTTQVYSFRDVVNRAYSCLQERLSNPHQYARKDGVKSASQDINANRKKGDYINNASKCKDCKFWNRIDSWTGNCKRMKMGIRVRMEDTSFSDSCSYFALRRLRCQ